MNDTSEANLHLLDYWRVIRYRWPFLLIAFIIVTGAAGITCYFLPREYYASITVEVKPDDTTLKIFSNEFTTRGNTDIRMAPTQFKIIQSKEVLYPVIERLDLVNQWRTSEPLTMERTYQLLQKKMAKSREIRGTDMFEIGVFSTDPQEAAAIVNAIGQEYQNRRRLEQESHLRQGLAELESVVAKQKSDKDAAQAEMLRIRDEEGIIDLNPETIASAESPEREVLTRSEAEVSQMQSKVAELETQLAETEKLDPAVLLSAIRTLGIDDSNVARLQPLYQAAVSEEARLLSSGLGPNHPRVKALRAQNETVYKQLSTELEGVRSALSTRLKVAQSTYEALKEKLEGEREKFNAIRRKSVGYTGAKERYLTAKSLYEGTETRLATLTMQGRMAIYPARIWDRAEPPQYPARPNVLLYMGIAVGAGLLVGFGIIFFLEYIDTSVKTVEEVEEALKIPVLAVIPKRVRLLADSPEDSADSEAYRVLQTNIDLARKEKSASTFTFVSGGVGEGKSTTLNNLACTYALSGLRTLIVDADFRRATQHEILGSDRINGLIEVLDGTLSWKDAVRSTNIKNLSFLPAGRFIPGSRKPLQPETLKPLMEELKTEYDVVFFDSPPILGLSDASIVVSLADITMMVIQYRRFPRSMLARVQQAVNHAHGNLYGAVLNNVDVERDSGYQYYTQYYDYYGSSGDTSRRRKSGGKAKPEEETVAQGEY